MRKADDVPLGGPLQCTFMWFLRLDRDTKRLSHCWQENGFSLVWIRRWQMSALDTLKDLWALGALVAFGLGVDPSVVFEGQHTGELLLTGAAEEGPDLVVEQGAGVAVGPAALAANEAPGATG